MREIGLILLLTGFLPLTAFGQVKIGPNDSIVWIGNTFAERMQYFGEVEARLHARYPEHNLVVRNLGWSADTVVRRDRPKNFGDTHHYLKAVQADVILACFGFNETWEYGGDTGVDTFQADLKSLLKDLRSRQYNGESTPQVILLLSHRTRGRDCS